MRFGMTGRVLGAAGGVLAGTAGLQALWLKSNYSSLPPARGPQRGTVRHMVRLSLSNRQLATEQPADATSSSVTAAVVAEPREDGSSPQCRRILFLGDSLVTGVGSSQESASGPPLPRVVAEMLSRRLGVDVQWSAVGETGLNVSELRTELLPAVALELRRAAAAGQPVDVVVVVCGLNDFKQAYRSVGGTAGNFRRELGASLLVNSPCSHAGCLLPRAHSIA